MYIFISIFPSINLSLSLSSFLFTGVFILVSLEKCHDKNTLFKSGKTAKILQVMREEAEQIPFVYSITTNIIKFFEL